MTRQPACCILAGLQCLKGVLQSQGELPSVLGTSLDELLRHVGSLRSQVLQVVISIFDELCELGSTSPHSASEPSSQVASSALTALVASHSLCCAGRWAAAAMLPHTAFTGSAPHGLRTLALRQPPIAAGAHPPSL